MPYGERGATRRYANVYKEARCPSDVFFVARWNQVMEELEDCMDEMPRGVCKTLELADDSDYAAGVRFLKEYREACLAGGPDTWPTGSTPGESGGNA